MANTVSKLKANSQRPTSMEIGSQVQCVSSWPVMVPTMPIIRPVTMTVDTW